MLIDVYKMKDDYWLLHLAIGVKTVLVFRPMTTMWGAEAFLGSLSLSGERRPWREMSLSVHSVSELRRRVRLFVDNFEDRA